MKQALPPWLERCELPDIKGTFKFDAVELRQALAGIMNYRPPVNDELMAFWSGRRWAHVIAEKYADAGVTIDAAKRAWGLVNSRQTDESIGYMARVVGHDGAAASSQGSESLGYLADLVSSALHEDGVRGQTPGDARLGSWLRAWEAGALGNSIPMHPLVETAIAVRVIAAEWGPIVAEAMTPHMIGVRVMNNAAWARMAPIATGPLLGEAGAVADWVRETPAAWMSWSRACAASWNSSLREAGELFGRWTQQSAELKRQLTASRMQEAPARHLADTLAAFQGQQFDIGRLANEAMVHFQTATQAVEAWISTGVLMNVNPERQRNRLFTISPEWTLEWQTLFQGAARPPLMPRSAALRGDAAAPRPAERREDMPPVPDKKLRQLDKEPDRKTRRSR